MNPLSPQSSDPNFSITPLRKRRLSDEIYAQILMQLSTGQYSVGDRLPTEKDLANMYNVSRPVVREALQHLQNDGLINARRGSGTFVLRLPPHEMADYTNDARIAQYMRAYEVRQCLEPEAARLAAVRITQVRLRPLAQALAKMEALMQNGSDAMEADFEFHLEIARATDNDLFEKQLHFLKPDMTGTMRIASSITVGRPVERRNRVLQEHRNIYQAIATGDGEMAKLHMQYHLASVRSRIMDQDT